MQKMQIQKLSATKFYTFQSCYKNGVTFRFSTKKRTKHKAQLNMSSWCGLVLKHHLNIFLYVIFMADSWTVIFKLINLISIDSDYRTC